jgi:hypothetical protein
MKTTNKILSIDIDSFESELPELNEAQIRAVKDKLDRARKAIEEFKESRKIIEDLKEK